MSEYHDSIATINFYRIEISARKTHSTSLNSETSGPATHHNCDSTPEISVPSTSQTNMKPPAPRAPYFKGGMSSEDHHA
ncbi:hypothetical protein N7488_003056 [Penicillium malachiteum]|nr:hypothetical protein N7488_003056 [Penicillium malachiteum]